MKNKVRRIAAVLAAVLLLTALPGAACHKSPFSDATQKPPVTWPVYSAQGIRFRFEAGFTAADWAGLSDDLGYQLGLLGASSHLTTLAYFVSPERDKGTHDYLHFACYRLDAPMTDEQLMGLMDPLNRLDMELNQGQLSAECVQNARIRLYGSVTALTYALRLTRGEVSCVQQFALVPCGTLLYQISYSDFTTASDSAALEQLLSSLTLPEGE